MIHEYASTYHLNEAQMLATIQVESGFNPNAIGDHGCSVGLVQINLCAHKDITREQALDPIYSIDWMASKFVIGQSYLWTAWRNLFG